MTAKQTNTASNFDFAAAMQELEAISNSLESADIDLQESIRKFERGAELAKQLKAYLDEAEHKVEQIQVDFTQSAVKNIDK